LENQSRRGFKKKLNEAQSLSGYVVGETLGSLARRLKMEPSEIVKLNSNENFFIPKGKLVILLLQVVEEYDPRTYPQEEESEVKKALGEYLGLSPDHIVIGSGGDQLIDLVTRLFLGKDDEAISIAPTFSMYRHSVSLQGSRYIEVPLKEDFFLNLEQISAKTTAKTMLFFLCSPNNPTANQFGIEEIRSLVEGFQGLVAIDEAYVEFANYSTARLVEEFENLVVLRTFSKAFGLASLRLGYAISNSNLTRAVSRAQLPYSVSSIALRMGFKLLENMEVVNEAVEHLKKERDRLIKRLGEIDGMLKVEGDGTAKEITLAGDALEIRREIKPTQGD